jgi:alpha-1,6-mannosyltransferase
VRQAARALRKLQPDLIEVGDPYQFAWSALRVRNVSGVPLCGFYHSDLPHLVRQRFGRMPQQAAACYVSNLYRRFDLVLAPSMLMVQRLRGMGINHVQRQPLGVDTEVFHPGRRDGRLRQQLGLPQQCRLLVYAGRFTREKKLTLLIEAVERLGHPYHLLMIGSGDDLPASAHATCLPFQHDARMLASLIASCDALVHAGDQETFGLVVLEAMACGIPVVGVAAGGVQELVDEHTGVLAQPGSARALAEAIEYLYQKDMALMGQNARRKVLETYDWEMIMPQLMKHYASLFAARQWSELEEAAAYAAE